MPREFLEKKTSLLPKKKEIPIEESPNAFVQAALDKKFETFSDNGSVKYTTSKDTLVDQFAAISNYKEPRPYGDIAADCAALWRLDPLICVKFIAYLRGITRDSKVVVAGQVTTIKGNVGQGLKHEGIFRLMWLAIHHKEAFMKNIPIFLAEGSWKDIIEMMKLDLQYHGQFKKKLDWEFLGNLIVAGLHNPEHEDLIKKYLPTIRATKACKTLEAQSTNLVGKFLAKKLFGLPEKEGDFSTYAKYRRLKNSGRAHIWQQRISKEEFNAINFNTIAGRALSLLVGSKFLKNQGLEEKYTKWIESKPVAKYTGYVYELFSPFDNRVNMADYQEITVNKQFQQLVEKAKVNMSKSKLLVARDVSGSMRGKATGTNISSFNVAKAMSLYFSELLTGPFSGIYLSFESKVEVRQWNGDTPCDKWKNDKSGAFGSTNFLGVCDFLIEMKEKGVPENEFPDGILCISDGEFNNSGKVSSFMKFKQLLTANGFSEYFVEEFKLILWDIPNWGGSIKPKFESFANAPNFFYMSGFDPSAIAFLFGDELRQKPTPKNASELAKAALDQELLRMIEL